MDIFDLFTVFRPDMGYAKNKKDRVLVYLEHWFIFWPEISLSYATTQKLINWVRVPYDGQ